LGSSPAQIFANKEAAMGTVRSFRDLEVWNAAMDLTLAAHKLAENLPPNHRFELASQMRRAATSIPSNIAEGQAYRSDRVFVRHVRIALGSLAELDTQIEIAVRLDYVSRDVELQLRTEIDRTRQLLHGLHRTLKASLRRTAVSVFALAAGGSGLLWLFSQA
jgi:four helix bundle protein